ncbi:MAG TPA: succinate dehydrogenase, cytochrome b556 subunit [Steroidobacteraceae bacterium]|nr:succinate dehydrogenase, cytochrome b556 subunit [Steroidobacteraceae bacterium]
MTSRERPLSPFMHYRWQYTNTLSILHRISGVFMSLGFILLVYWLVSAAAGEESYDASLDVLSTPLFKVLLFLWLLSFYYHLFNGIRHLCWDMGRGFERSVAKATGMIVLVSAIVLTVLTWMCLCLRLATGISGGLV